MMFLLSGKCTGHTLRTHVMSLVLPTRMSADVHCMWAVQNPALRRRITTRFERFSAADINVYLLSLSLPLLTWDVSRSPCSN